MNAHRLIALALIALSTPALGANVPRLFPDGIVVGSDAATGNVSLTLKGQLTGTAGAFRLFRQNTDHWGIYLDSNSPCGNNGLSFYNAPNARYNGCVTPLGQWIIGPVDKSEYQYINAKNLYLENPSGAAAIRPNAFTISTATSKDFDTYIGGATGVVFINTNTAVAIYSKIGSALTLISGSLSSGWTASVVTASGVNSAVRLTNNSGATQTCQVTFINIW